MPNLAVGSDTRSHLVTGMITHAGGRSDAPDFHWLLIEAWCRCKPKEVLADAGYDSAMNHALARDRMGIRSWIKAKVGRPTNNHATHTPFTAWRVCRGGTKCLICLVSGFSRFQSGWSALTG
jgi:hypothetical protein